MLEALVTSDHLDDPREVLPVHVVVGLEEHLPQPALADRVVFRVKLVEAVEGIPVLKSK